MIRYSATINVMIQAATKTSHSLVRDFGEVEQLQVSRKSLIDFVSFAHSKAKNILIKELTRARSGYSFLMEQGQEEKGSDEHHRWIIDPLDGTINFLHGIPHWAISIGLEKDGHIIAGLIYHPIHNEMYCAEHGRGAFMNERRLRVSARRHLNDALISAPCVFNQPKDAIAEIRQFGVTSLDFAYVAAGRYDGFWALGIKPWHRAAGTILVKEAGGFFGIIDEDIILATNNALFDPLNTSLRQFLTEPR